MNSKASLEKPELLAPLNNWKSLAPQTKVLELADAVYFGLRSNFSMRARAVNFGLDEVRPLVEKVHSLDKKCYLTTNIIIYNTELVELHQSIAFAKEAGVDAIICHDIASIMIAKQLGMPFHISTQANISNKISARFYESLGAERLILSRELDLDDIKEITEEVKIPIETFVHGAMCTAVSGRCYLSAEMMNFDPEFSANRGKCVQPCRRYYEFLGEENHEVNYDKFSGMFFNSKDLCMIGHVPELIEANIKSFKLEGRMRDPLYLTEVVSCYREAIDSYYDNTYTQEKIEGWINRLEKVFNRGFHTGFYYSKPGVNDVEKTVRGNVSKWHKELIGKVKNYYPKAKAIELELFAGQIRKGDQLIFENPNNFYYTQMIKSLQIEDSDVDCSPVASKDEHILVGIKVEGKIPMNCNVFLFHEKKGISK